MPKKRHRALSFQEKIQRTAAFKRFKEENLDKLRVEIEAEAALQDENRHYSNPESRVLLKAFANTPEGQEAERQIQDRLVSARIWAWFCDEIILRSDIFLKWCRRNKIWPWPMFNFDHPRHRVLRDPVREKFNEFMATKPGQRASERLQMHKILYPHLYGKQTERGFGVRNLFPADDYKRPVTHSSYDTIPFSKLTPYEKALKAYLQYLHRKELMEITRLLFPQTEGLNPSYDEETNRCLQQVKRWSAKVDELIRLIDAP